MLRARHGIVLAVLGLLVVATVMVNSASLNLSRGGETTLDSVFWGKHTWFALGAAMALLVGAMVPVDRLGRTGATWWTTPVFWVAVAVVVGMALVQVPGWVGCELFGRNDPEPLLTFPEWREGSSGKSALSTLAGSAWIDHFKKDQPDFPSVDYWGYFIGHSRDLAPDREFIRGLFRFQPDFLEFAERRLARLRTVRRRILAVHLRRGDYGYACFFQAPCAWYEACLRDAGLDPSEWIIYVCSEDPKRYRGRFGGFKTADFSDMGAPDGLAAYLDFYVMTKADKVLTANSSFSFMATMLNENHAEFLRPCAETERLVRYDPWDADVLLRFTPTPETHQRFIDQD
jgi:hypothetical protein